MPYISIIPDKYEEVKHLLRNELKEVCDFLDKKRKKIFTINGAYFPIIMALLAVPILGGILIILGFIVYLFFLLFGDEGVFWGVIFLFLLFGLYIWYLDSKSGFKRYKTKDLNYDYQTKILARLVPVYFESVDYQPTKFISKGLFLKSGFSAQDSFRFKGTNLFQGKINGISMAFSQIATSGYSSKRKSKGLVEENFEGILFILSYPIKFHSTTLVINDKHAQLFGDLSQMIQKKLYGDALVNLEDPKFEKLFTVLSTDQIEARYLLSFSMMEYLTELQEKSKMKLSFSFSDNKLFIALPSRRNIFNPDLRKPIRESVIDTIKYMEVIATIAEDIYDMHKHMIGRE